MSRLEVLSAELEVMLHEAPEARQRAAALEACEFAITQAQLKHQLIDKAMEDLRYGHTIPSNERAALQALATQLDDEYLDLQDEFEKGRASESDYMRAFGQARAASAVSSAISDQAFEAAAEAIYEAAATVDDSKTLFAAIRKILLE